LGEPQHRFGNAQLPGLAVLFAEFREGPLGALRLAEAHEGLQQPCPRERDTAAAIPPASHRMPRGHAAQRFSTSKTLGDENLYPLAGAEMRCLNRLGLRGQAAQQRLEGGAVGGLGVGGEDQALQFQGHRSVH